MEKRIGLHAEVIPVVFLAQARQQRYEDDDGQLPPKVLRPLRKDSGLPVAQALESFLHALPIRPVFLSNVYDPTLGDDGLNFLGIEPSLIRQSYRLMNDVLAELARRYGDLVDLYTHVLSGDPSWYTQIIEPSLRGASEIRRCFLRQVLPYVRRQRTL